MANPKILWALDARETVLAALLAEYTEHHAQAPFALTQTPGTADVQVLAAASAAELERIRNTAAGLQAEHPAHVRLLLLAPELEWEGGEEDFAGIFKKPVRLAALLDAGMNAWRVRRMKTARSLSRHVQLNPFTRTLEDKASGLSQQLSAREAAFLFAILDSGPEGLTRARAITQVWGYHRDVDSHAIETAMYRLRQKLQPLFGEKDVLESRGGVYVWKG